jgi:hypothetical protein
MAPTSNRNTHPLPLRHITANVTAQIRGLCRCTTLSLKSLRYRDRAGRALASLSACANATELARAPA